jgi:hypothetical protein
VALLIYPEGMAALDKLQNCTATYSNLQKRATSVWGLGKLQDDPVHTAVHKEM